jgi:hypothetical protein
MQYALNALHASRVIGAVGVLTHPLDDAAREFYRQFDFEDLPFDPRRAMILRMVDLRRQFSGIWGRPLSIEIAAVSTGVSRQTVRRNRTSHENRLALRARWRYK